MDEKTRQIIERIEGRYNADHDVDPAGPPVTWAERDLLELVKALIERVDRLEQERAEVTRW